MRNTASLPADICVAAGLSHPDGEAPDSRITVCHNLRPSPDGAPELVPVGQPAPVAAGSYRPLAVVTLGDGRRLLAVASGKTLATLDLSQWMPEPVEIATLGAEPLCATAAGRRLTVMTDAGPTTVIFGDTPDDVAVIAPDTVFPEVGITAVTAAKAVATIAPIRLDKSFAEGKTYVDTAQRARVTEAMNDAYEDLARQAAADGAFFQPVICRYRLYDADSTVIYVSPPVVVSLPAGTQLTDSIDLRSDDMAMTYPVNISADTFRIRLTIPPHALAPRAAAAAAQLRLFVTPQYHPVDFALAARCSAVIRSTTDKTVMRASWPGTMRGLASSTARAAETLLRESIARLDSIERPVLSVSDPFASAAGTTVTLTATGAATAAGESETLARALAAPFAPRWDKSLMFAAPHSFSARTVVASGDTTVWGDLTQRFFRGWSTRSFAVSTKAKRWRAAVWTDLTASTADPEESVVSLASGDGDAPELFSPVICYPSARASKMTVCLSVEGEDPVTQTFDLTRVAGDMAVYVHPSLRPFALADVAEAYVIPAERPATHSFPSAMAVARSLSPLSAIAVADLSRGRVNALAVSRYNRSALTIRQQRFTVFADSGIHTLALTGPDGREANLLEIDRRTVASQAATASVDGKVYALTNAGQLIRVTSSSAETIADGVDATALAWIALRRELICLGGADGNATVICPDRDRGRYTRSLPALTGIVADDATAEVYAATDSTVVSLVNETAPASTDIAWSVTLDTPGRRPAVVAALDADIGAANIRGTLSLTRHSSLNPAAAPIAAFDIEGRLGAPLTLRNLGPAAARYTVTLTATTASRLALHLIRLHLHQCTIHNA